MQLVYELRSSTVIKSNQGAAEAGIIRDLKNFIYTAVLDLRSMQ